MEKGWGGWPPHSGANETLATLPAGEGLRVDLLESMRTLYGWVVPPVMAFSLIAYVYSLIQFAMRKSGSDCLIIATCALGGLVLQVTLLAYLNVSGFISAFDLYFLPARLMLLIFCVFSLLGLDHPGKTDRPSV